MADDEMPDITAEPVLPREEQGVPAGHEAPASPPESAPASAGPGSAHAVTVVSLRVVRGLAGMAAAAAVIAAVGLVTPPTTGISPLETTVEPQAADLLAVCPGGLLRLGDDSGANAGQPFPVGAPELTIAATGAPSHTPLEHSDAGTGGTDRAPTLLRLEPSDDAALTAAQAQTATGDGGIRGLAASGCGEPTSSAWLVGGATTVGRTTLLLIANPSDVDAEVSIELWGESGAVSAPGMKGIEVPARSQRVLPLSGFAPDLASPVVHVEARGGRIVAALQTSAMRVLDPGGVDLVTPGSAPTRELVIPGVRIFDETGVASSLGMEGYEDLEAIVRVGNPGDEPVTVAVSVTSTVEGGVGTSFQIEVPAGAVADTALSAALELGSEPLADGSYTVVLSAESPIVGGVRTSTIPAPTTDDDGELVPGPADLAWFASASALTGDTAVAIADAPHPVLVATAQDGEAHELTLTPLGGGSARTLSVPASGSVTLGLPRDTGYLLTGARGVVVALSFAGTGQLAGYPVVSPRAADSPLVVRP